MDGPVFGQRTRPTSNSFASGSNQNSGNILCDVPSTRVARPPGGASSISFGWDDDRPEPPRGSGRPKTGPSSFDERQGYAVAGGASRTSSNSFATGSNQNCGNVISDISSTRVISPPGGSSSLSFGWGDHGGSQSMANKAESSRPQRRSGGYASTPGEGFSASSPQAKRMAARNPMATRGCESRPGDGYSPPDSPVAGAQEDGLSPPTSPVGSQTYAPQLSQEARNGYAGPLPSSSEKVWMPEPAASPQNIRSWAGVDNSARQDPARQSPSGQSPQSRQQEDAFGTRPRVTGNAYASGSNQNCGNVMTGVPSTRVNRPPGGASGFSLAWDTEEQQVTSMNTSPRDRRAAGGISSSQPTGQPGARRGQQQSEAFGTRPRDSSNTFATGSNQNCGNMISDTPTTRVMRPPGGASSFSLGWG